MTSPCPHCGRAFEPAATFCPYCGGDTVPAGNAAAAVAAELRGFDALGPSASPDELGELTEKFLAAADETARDFGGAVIREGATAVVITLPPEAGPPASRAASCAAALREAVRDAVAAGLSDPNAAPYLKAGVDAVTEEAAGGELLNPRIGAQRLKNKASPWAILASDRVFALTSEEFSYTTVGFYQTRSGEPAVKIYELGESRTSPPPGPFGEERLLRFPPGIRRRRKRIFRRRPGGGTGRYVPHYGRSRNRQNHVLGVRAPHRAG